MTKTLVVDNFRGSMTAYQDGDINSGLAFVVNVVGYNPFVKPGNLTWCRSSVQIDSGGSVITDLIMAAKERVESGILYVYAIGHTGRLYKIQVNDPVTFNPDYDNPVLLATLTAQSPTFTRGGSIDFFGATERIYIGHDKGVTRIDFDGTNETFIGVAGSYTATIPRPLKQFIGKLYFGNGANIGEIDSTATITDYTKLDPGFPDNTQIKFSYKLFRSKQFIGKLYFGNGANIGEIDSTATITDYTKLDPGFPDNTQIKFSYKLF